jgi:hypothetical protein
MRSARNTYTRKVNSKSRATLYYIASRHHTDFRRTIQKVWAPRRSKKAHLLFHPMIKPAQIERPRVTNYTAGTRTVMFLQISSSPRIWARAGWFIGVILWRCTCAVKKQWDMRQSESSLTAARGIFMHMKFIISLRRVHCICSWEWQRSTNNSTLGR